MSALLKHGVLERVSERVRRIVAPNPGMMTGSGTNSYILGERSLAVVDPGPAIDSHIEALLAACGDRLRWIMVTHTHPDHSPAAKVLAAATGAQLMGNTLADDGHQDTSFVSDHSFVDGERFATDEFSLLALHTPGHVGNHFCFLIEEDGLLLTGDHLMNGSTVVIIPPHGDMRAYLDSLQKLLDHPLRFLGPGHGDIMPDPLAVVRQTMEHRRWRERKLLECLAAAGGEATMDALLPTVYDDVDPRLHPMAKLSLWAHLIKLRHDGLVVENAEVWRLEAEQNRDG